MIAQSELAGNDTVADVGLKILAGRELGMGPVASVQNIIMVKGRPTLKAQTWAALIKRHPRYDYRVKTHTNEVCAIDFLDNAEIVGTSTFTMDDAKRAGLAGGDNWRKYPSAMLFARAVTQGGRTYCPDVAVGGIYTPDELDEGYEPEPITVTASDDGGSKDAPRATDGAPSQSIEYGDDATWIGFMQDELGDWPYGRQLTARMLDEMGIGEADKLSDRLQRMETEQRKTLHTQLMEAK